MFAMIDLFWFVAGGAAVWFGREPITVWYKGVENQIGALNDKIQKLKAKL